MIITDCTYVTSTADLGHTTMTALMADHEAKVSEVISANNADRDGVGVVVGIHDMAVETGIVNTIVSIVTRIDFGVTSGGFDAYQPARSRYRAEDFDEETP